MVEHLKTRDGGGGGLWGYTAELVHDELGQTNNVVEPHIQRKQVRSDVRSRCRASEAVLYTYLMPDGRYHEVSIVEMAVR